jgi:CSLREA domain-containing protein
MNRSFLLSATVATTLALAVICGAAGAKPAYGATTITVNTTSDEAVTDGQCSLREAISNANANSDTTAGDCAPGNPGADTIDLSSLNGAISLAFDLDGISDDLTIAGPGANALTINANGSGEVFGVFSAAATISGLTMSGANDSAILNEGTLTLKNSTISNNSSGSDGGGIANLGTLAVANDTIRGNTAHFVGGGIWNFGNATITASTISGNESTLFGGGGIANGGTLSIVNSTISDNTAGDGGGGISNFQQGPLTMVNSTISHNRAPIGGGICCGSMELRNTIVAGQLGGGNCALVTIFDGGYNLDDGTSCGFSTANNSLSNTDPLLDPAGLKNNGGRTQTIALQRGSPAIDVIPAGVNGCGTTITSDQRGVSRPQGAGCDIGAFEFVPPQTLTVEIDIEPGEFPNVIDLGSKGKIPVAVLSTADFSAPQQVDTASLKFGRTGNEASLAFCSAPQDVNGDGLLDVLCHFSARKAGFQLGDTEGVLTGTTIVGVPIRGTDSVVVVSSS